MKHTYLNESINDIIKSHIADDINIAHFLMDILNISRESAYRRLRNEILYSMKEVAILASKLNFSLDKILSDINEHSNSISARALIKEATPADNYIEMMRSTLNVVDARSSDRNIRAFYVGNKIPNNMLLNFKLLTKLRYIRWIHQTHNLPINSRFADIAIPLSVEKIHKEYLEANRNIKQITCIFDENIIEAVINTIKFYYRRHLITNDEVLIMKKEIHMLIDRLGETSRLGKNPRDIECIYYLSDLNIESNILFFDFDKDMSVHLLSSGKMPVVSSNIRVCEEQKLWINSLLRFSVLISGSNELLLNNFIMKQHNLVNIQLQQLLENEVYTI